jgi:restriction system protein
MRARTLIRNILNPEDFRREASRLYYQWRENQPKEIPEFNQEVEASVSQSVFETASTFEEAEETAWSEIEQYVQVMNPYGLQN